MKYEIRICRCGRIHFFPKDKLNNVTEHESFLLICSGCGESMIYGYVSYVGSEEKPVYRPHLADVETVRFSDFLRTDYIKAIETACNEVLTLCDYADSDVIATERKISVANETSFFSNRKEDKCVK